jgi:hypothetical protein
MGILGPTGANTWIKICVLVSGVLKARLLQVILKDVSIVRLELIVVNKAILAQKTWWC